MPVAVRAHSTRRSSSSTRCDSEFRHDQRNTVGPEHPPQLGDGNTPIRHVVEHVHRERDIEAVGFERQRLGVDDEQGRLSRRRAGRSATCPETDLRAQQALMPAPEQGSEIAAVAGSRRRELTRRRGVPPDRANR